MNESARKKTAKLCLILAASIWGSAFVVMKNTIENLPTFYLLAIRFTGAALLLALIFHRKLPKINREYLWRGGLMGLFLWLAYVTQTFGLHSVTPSVNAFLTTVYCVIVPFLYWITAGKRPGVYHIAAALLSVLGVGLVSLDGPLTGVLVFGSGNLLTLLGGFFFAAHMVTVANCAKGRDVFLLTTLQFASAGVIAWAFGLLTETFPAHLEIPTLFGLIYLSVFATGVALLLQSIGQKNTEPAAASVLLSLESVFGVLCSMLFYGERPTPRLFCGFAIIFCAVLCSETQFEFIRRPWRAKAKPEEEREERLYPAPAGEDGTPIV